MACPLDSPDVGKHLKDHLQVGLFFPAPGVGVSMSEMGISMGPDALRAPAGPLPADPADDARSSARAPGAQGRGRAAGHRVGDHRPRARVVVALRRGAWFSTGLGDDHTHDAQLAFFVCGYNRDIWQRCCGSTRDEYFDDADVALAPDAESIIVLANPVQPHSEGEIVLASADPTRRTPTSA